VCVSPVALVHFASIDDSLELLLQLHVSKVDKSQIDSTFEYLPLTPQVLRACGDSGDKALNIKGQDELGIKCRAAESAQIPIKS
jgi:hypothetical protein